MGAICTVYLPTITLSGYVRISIHMLFGRKNPTNFVSFVQHCQRKEGRTKIVKSMKEKKWKKKKIFFLLLLVTVSLTVIEKKQGGSPTNCPLSTYFELLSG